MVVGLPRQFIEAVPPDVEDATKSAIDARNDQLDRVSASLLARMTTLGQAVLTEVSTALLDQLAPRLRGLTAVLGRLTNQWATDATTIVWAEQEAAIAVGQALIDEPLLAASVEIVAPEVSLALFDTVQDFSADLIQGLSQDMLQRVNAELRLGALGQKSTDDMIRAIGDIVPANTGTKGGAAFRGETIGITEVGRVHSMASWQRMQQALVVRPDLMKQWLHSGLVRNPRDGHVAYSGTIVPVAQPFVVAPIRGALAESMRYPRDPAASARNTVRCKCTALPYLPEWQLI